MSRRSHQATRQGKSLLSYALYSTLLYRFIVGKTHYNAPSGFHDNCVIALALAYKFAKATPMIIRGGSGISRMFDNLPPKNPWEETIEEKMERIRKLNPGWR